MTYDSENGSNGNAGAHSPFLEGFGGADNGADTPITRPAKVIPPIPEDFTEASGQIWQLVWTLPRTSPEDAPTIERLCRLEDEAATLRAVLAEHGPVLKRPMQNSRGIVIGEDYYPHPAVESLRRIGREAGVLCDSLGMSPQARQKMGLEVLADPRPPDAIDAIKAKHKARRRRAGTG